MLTHIMSEYPTRCVQLNVVLGNPLAYHRDVKTSIQEGGRICQIKLNGTMLSSIQRVESFRLWKVCVFINFLYIIRVNSCFFPLENQGVIFLYMVLQYTDTHEALPGVSVPLFPWNKSPCSSKYWYPIFFFPKIAFSHFKSVSKEMNAFVPLFPQISGKAYSCIRSLCLNNISPTGTYPDTPATSTLSPACKFNASLALSSEYILSGELYWECLYTPVCGLGGAPGLADSSSSSIVGPAYARGMTFLGCCRLQWVIDKISIRLCSIRLLGAQSLFCFVTRRFKWIHRQLFTKLPVPAEVEGTYQHRIL